MLDFSIQYRHGSFYNENNNPKVSRDDEEILNTFSGCCPLTEPISRLASIHKWANMSMKEKRKSPPETNQGRLCRILTDLLKVCMVPMAGVEPAQLLPLPPQDSVSTNSTTSACLVSY